MSHFPVLYKRAHLAAFRAHVEALHGAPFGAVYNRYIFHVTPSAFMYSQFNIICTCVRWCW